MIPPRRPNLSVPIVLAKTLQSNKVVFAIIRLKFSPVPDSFNCIAKQLLCYGFEIWDSENDYEIELQYMKFIHLQTNTAAHGELGQFPFHLFHQTALTNLELAVIGCPLKLVIITSQLHSQ